METNDQLYSQFADESALEKQRDFILGLFTDVQNGMKKLSDMGIKINTGNSIPAVEGLSNEFEGLGDTIKKQQKQLVDMAVKLAALTTAEGKQVEALKQVTALTKGLTAEEVRAEKLRQGAYEDLQRQKQANNELNKSIQLRIKIREAESGSLEQLRLKYTKLEGIIVKLSETQRNSARGQALIKQADEQKNKINELQKSFGNFTSNVGRYSESLGGAFDLIAQEISKLQAKQQSLITLQKNNPIGFKLQGGQDDLNKTNAALEQLNQTQQIGFKTNQSYAVTVKQTEKAFQNMTAAGNVSEEFLQEFKTYVAEAKDSAQDLKDEIKALSSDTRKLDLAAGAVSFLASSFEAAAGASALLGADSKDVQKSIQKLVAIQSVANGVREAAEQITKRGTAANKAYNFVLQQGTVLFGKGSTAAQRFGAALKGIVILAVVGFIIQLIQSLGDTDDAAEAATKSIEKLNKELERNKNILASLDKSDAYDFKKRIEDLKKAGLERLKLAKDEKDKLKIENDNKKQEFAAELSFREDQINKLRVRQENANDDEIKEAQKQNNYLANLHKAGINKISDEEAKALAERRSITEKENAQALADLQDAIREKNLFIKANQTQLTQQELDAIEARRKKAKEDFENEKKDALELFKYRQSLVATQAEFASSDDSLLGTKARLQAAKDEADAKSKSIIAQKNYELSQERVTASGRTLIIEKAANDIADIEYNLQKKLVDIRVQGLERQKQEAQEGIDFFQKAQQDRFEAEQLERDKNFQKEQDNIAKSKAEELALNATNFEAGLKTQEEYNERKEQIEYDFQRRILESQLRFYKLQRNALKALGEDTTAIDKAIAEAEAALAQGRVEKNKATVAEHKALADAIKKNYLDAFEEIGKAFINVFSAIGERRKAQLQDEIDDIDKRKEAELAAVDASSDSDEKKAARQKLIETRAQTAKDERERKQRQIDRQRAIFERGYQLFQIGIDTITAVNKIKLQIATAPPPLKPLYISSLFLAIASGAASATAILAQPLPKFAKGGTAMTDTLAEVAEEGREMSIDPKGRLRIFNKKQVAKLVKGERILTNRVTEDILAAASKDIRHPQISNMPELNDNDRQDDIVYELKQLNKKSGISIYNQQGIETTPWYNHQIKN